MTKCDYHPENESISKCEFCGKFICVECKMIYKHRYTTTGGRGGSIPHCKTYETCPPCYYDNMIEDVESPDKTFCPICSGLIWIIVLTVILFSSDFAYTSDALMAIIFFIFIGILVMTYGIVNLFKVPEKKDWLRKKKEEFLDSINSSQ